MEFLLGGGIVGAVLIFALYWVPSIVAISRKTPSTGMIILLNLFLGWTVIGWIIALIMAFQNPSTTMVTVNTGYMSGQPGLASGTGYAPAYPQVHQGMPQQAAPALTPPPQQSALGAGMGPTERGRAVGDQPMRLFAEPHPSSSAVGMVNPGSVLAIGQSANGFSRVRLIDGREGWLPSFLAAPDAVAAPAMTSGERTLRLFSSPDRTAASTGTVAPRTPVQLLESSGEFVRVRLPDAREGWLPSVVLAPAS